MRFTIFVGLAGILAGTVGAQAPGSPRESPLLRGVVVDSAEAPIPAVELTLLPLGLRTRSDEEGRFSISVPTAGVYRVVARRIGFVPDTFAVTLPAGRTVEARLRLGRVGLLVAREVRALQFTLPRTVDRVDRGISQLMLADEIKAFRLFDLADMLGFVPRFSRVGAVFVDGRPVTSRLDLPHPNDVAAVELARGMVGRDFPDLWVPATQRRNVSRDVVMIWTVFHVARAQTARIDAARDLQEKLDRERDRAKRDSLRAASSRDP